MQCSKAKFNAAVVFEHSVFLMGHERNWVWSDFDEEPTSRFALLSVLKRNVIHLLLWPIDQILVQCSMQLNAVPFGNMQ